MLLGVTNGNQNIQFKQVKQDDFLPHMARRRQLELGRRILQSLSWSTYCFTLTIWNPRASSATTEMLIKECMVLFYDNRNAALQMMQQSIP